MLFTKTLYHPCIHPNSIPVPLIPELCTAGCMIPVPLIQELCTAGCMIPVPLIPELCTAGCMILNATRIDLNKLRGYTVHQQYPTLYFPTDSTQR